MSVENQKLKSELLREALLKGWTKPADVQSPWTTQLEPSRIDKWYKRLYRVPDEPLPVQARLVNHFMLGADPEFIFHNGVARVDARAQGLKAGPAFGADNNGRLCELRPQPSRSALSVLASIWLSMRWMVVYHPELLGLNWRSGCYYEGDGLGGHIHFGRKRDKLREREISVLDRLTHLEFSAGIFDREEGRMRVRHAQGAPSGQPYGALGDFRLQPHGYEYRTLPSWIDNPWLAYFNLVLSKLAVAFPDLVAPLTAEDAGLTSEQARNQLRMQLAYFTAQDDDARLAATVLSRRGFPRHAEGLDFKSAWGLFPAGPLGSAAEAKAPAVLPELIPPTGADEAELALSMFEGRPPELTPLAPTWVPCTLPAGYTHWIRQVDTKVAPGLGEFAMQLCVHSEYEMKLVNMGHQHEAFRFPANIKEEMLRNGVVRKMGVPVTFSGDKGILYINASKDYSLEQLLQARDALLASNIYPFWDVRKVHKDSYVQWKNRPKYLHKGGSKMVYEGEIEGASKEVPF